MSDRLVVACDVACTIVYDGTIGRPFAGAYVRLVANGRGFRRGRGCRVDLLSRAVAASNGTLGEQ